MSKLLAAPVLVDVTLPVEAILNLSVPPILISTWSSVSAEIVVSASASKIIPSDVPLTSIAPSLQYYTINRYTRT